MMERIREKEEKEKRENRQCVRIKEQESWTEKERRMGKIIKKR